MRTLALHVYDYSLDGIFGEEETDFYKFCRGIPEDPEQEAWTYRGLERAEVHIMGRVTYQGMARYFPGATDHPLCRHPEQSLQVSVLRHAEDRRLGQLDDPQWQSHRRDPALKHAGNGEIPAHGGLSFARSLVQSDLVDEYRLHVTPYLAGSGNSLFAEAAAPGELELAFSQAFANGMLGLTYRRRRPSQKTEMCTGAKWLAVTRRLTVR